MKGSSYYEEFSETWSKENNVDFLNFVDYFRYIKDKSKVEKLKLIEEIFFENDMHLNRTGNNLFYIELVKFLES
jgi:hypothetical protein